uniref:MARVEL domain-containing protein n=1 Tax=Strongyloides papillosus TaxID=174720 RepID=A0A0N5BIY3_STREA
MDFSPTADKWKCCCCLLPQGLQILALIEIIIFFSLLIGTLIFTVTSQPSTLQDIIFNYSFIFVLAFFTLSSILLIIGLRKIIPTLLYPTILARILLIIFLQIFGVSKTLLTDEALNEDEEMEYNSRNEYYHNRGNYKNSKQYAAVRFVGFVFLFIFITIALIYTIYIVVRALKYVNGYSKLLIRRSSLVAAEVISDNMIAQHYRIESLINESHKEQGNNGSGEQLHHL